MQVTGPLADLKVLASRILDQRLTEYNVLCKKGDSKNIIGHAYYAHANWPTFSSLRVRSRVSRNSKHIIRTYVGSFLGVSWL